MNYYIIIIIILSSLMVHFCCKKVINLVNLGYICSQFGENRDVIIQLSSHVMVSIEGDQ